MKKAKLKRARSRTSRSKRFRRNTKKIQTTTWPSRSKRNPLRKRRSTPNTDTFSNIILLTLLFPTQISYSFYIIIQSLVFFKVIANIRSRSRYYRHQLPKYAPQRVHHILLRQLVRSLIRPFVPSWTVARPRSRWSFIRRHSRASFYKGSL